MMAYARTLLFRRRVRRMARDPWPAYVHAEVGGSGIFTPVTFMNTPALMREIGYCVTQK